jgi:S1-C subfamily serine protease
MPAPQVPKVPTDLQPSAEDYAFDIDRAFEAVVGISTRVPPHAFTAETLGVERAGHGVIIRSDGLVLTIGYLVAEADDVWLTLSGGRVERGHVVAYDTESGFGLVQILARVELPFLPLGSSAELGIGTRVVLAGAGGRQHCVATRVVSRQQFTGYWEYLVDDAIFTSPAHPYWGGAALLGAAGELLGIASLQVMQEEEDVEQQVNMIVPIDLLKPILDDLATMGRRRTPPRPWLGLYAGDVENHVVVVGVSTRGPAKSADVRVGDVVIGVNGELVRDASEFFKRIWASGAAGARVRVLLQRDGRRLEVPIKTVDRTRYFASPRLH